MITATANDDGTWICDEPIMQKWLMITAGKDQVKEHWLYVPDMSEAMVLLVENIMKDNIKIVKRDTHKPAPPGVVY